MKRRVSRYLLNYRMNRMPHTMFKAGRTEATESGERKVLSLIPRLARSWTVFSDDRVIYLHRATEARWKRNPDSPLPITRSMGTLQIEQLCKQTNEMGRHTDESRVAVDAPRRRKELPMNPMHSSVQSRREPLYGRSGLLRVVCLVCLIVAHATLADQSLALEQQKHPGVSGGETTQQSGQQGLGLDGAGSSNVILGGPEIIIGAIQNIQGEKYTINGDRGQQVQIRVTSDTNKVCPSGGQPTVSSGQEGVSERDEIPPTPFMKDQSVSGTQSGAEDTQGLNDQQDLKRHAESPPSSDPSTMKARLGSTDPLANEDTARGSGFAVGGCTFKKGDHVRVEASDMGMATTIKRLVDSRRGQDAQ